MGATTYSFGPFQLDAQARRLTRDGEPVALGDRHLEILLTLVSRPGTIVSKDALIEAAWDGVAVTDNSLEQAISSLRRTLGLTKDGAAYIETLARRGYRVSVPVGLAAHRHSSASLDAMLAPHRAFLDGRAALETLNRDAVARASALFEEMTRTSPDYAPAHLGLANALALRFEATRAEAPDGESLRKAVHHADQACRLDAASGEAWAALGLVCHQSRDFPRAVAASQRAVALEPDNWRHHLRLAYVSWGEERLRSARRVLQLLPGFPFAHWLAATVQIARQAYVDAERELVAGAAAQDSHGEGSRFAAVGLHLLLALVRLNAGDSVAATRELERELAVDRAAHIYAREARANSWCAIAAIRQRQGDADAAIAACDEALATLPGHVIATAARLAWTVGMERQDAQNAFRERLSKMRHRGAHVEAALAEATYEALCDRHDRAAGVVQTAIEDALPYSPAWAIPVDPFLNVHANPAPWERVLTLVRTSAM